MELLDYTGKLNTHDEYLKILENLEEKCKYIELVILGERESNEIVDEFKNDIILKKKVKSWLGTGLYYQGNKLIDLYEEDPVYKKLYEENRQCIKNNWLYRINASKAFFEYLKKYETFCKYYFGKRYDKEIDGYVDVQERTNFGYDDIAFFDNREMPLLYTTTHECYIIIRDDLEK